MPKDENKITTIFDWSHPQDLSMETVERFGLVKGVVMQEGDARYTEAETGEIKKIGTMTRDNVIFGGGGLAGIARAGQAIIDIDHHKQSVPQTYKQHKEINSHYPVGHVLDAQAVERNGKMVVEFIATVHNPAVFAMIKEGKIKGNSVTDYGRGKKCDDKDGCEFVGSTYGRNSFMLEEIPSMPGTWVAPITQDDIGNNVKPTEHRMTTPASALLVDITKSELSLSTKDEIVSHLQTREIADDMAGDIADFMIANPDAFNEHQIAHMEKADWETWWTKSGSNAVKMFKMQKQIDQLSQQQVEKPEVEKTEAEPEIKEAVEKLKDEPIKEEDVRAWLKENKYQEPQKVEEPQTTPQTEAPETEKVEAEPEPEVKAESKVEPEAEPTPETEPTEHSIHYVRGGTDPLKDDSTVSKIMGAIGAFRDTHNSIVVSPYMGKERRLGLNIQSEIQRKVKNLIYTAQNDHNVRFAMEIVKHKMHIQRIE